jgi:hypothetical protein
MSKRAGYWMNRIMDELGHFSARLPKENLVLMNGKVSPGQTTDYDIVMLISRGTRSTGGLIAGRRLHLSVSKRGM